MPVCVEGIAPGHHLFAESAGDAGAAGALTVGVVNNMPDGALVSTERQLFDLLREASGERTVRLRFYSLSRVVRSDWGRDHVGQHYATQDALCAGPLDGLIVTGAEPLAPTLPEEPYWPQLGEVVDWARANTRSTILSCLAVHAAVRHLDGIDRRPLPEKCIGVFEQACTMDHPMLRDMPAPLLVPHARWNEIREEQLAPHGYTVLTRSTDAGVDIFVKSQAGSLFVFLQGHPEYDAVSLLGEYRRDIGRLQRGEAPVYPNMPRGYFSEPMRAALVDFRERALLDRRPEMLQRFPVQRAAEGIANTWREGAVQLYRNWLIYLSPPAG